MNFLEQLAAEWYLFLGYFVLTNLMINPGPRGGYQNELDALGFDPNTKRLVHVETSGDAESWDERKTKFTQRKFTLSDDKYKKLIGMPISGIIKRPIVGQYRTTQANLDWGNGIQVTTIPDFVSEICSNLRDRDPLIEGIPEKYPRLRSMQYTLAYGCTNR